MKITSRIVITAAVICAMGIAGTAIAKGRAEGERRAHDDRRPRAEMQAPRHEGPAEIPMSGPTGNPIREPEWKPSFGFGQDCGFVNRRPACSCAAERPKSDAKHRFKPNRPNFGKKADVFSPDMPHEIRMKVVELEKLRIDLREVMTRRDIDVRRAAEINREILRAESEVKAWRFERKLERMAAKKEMRRERGDRADGAPARDGEMKPRGDKDPDGRKPEHRGDRGHEDGKQERPGGEKRPPHGEGEKKPR